MPKRIQRQRTKGWRMPEGAVYVGRPSMWGNPFRVSDGRCRHPDCEPGSHPGVTATQAVTAFEMHWRDLLEVPAQMKLRGKDLCCWCPLDQPCHADVLLEWANS